MQKRERVKDIYYLNMSLPLTAYLQIYLLYFQDAPQNRLTQGACADRQTDHCKIRQHNHEWPCIEPHAKIFHYSFS